MLSSKHYDRTMIQSLKLFCTAVLKTWWIYAAAVPTAVASLLGLYLPSFLPQFVSFIHSWGPWLVMIALLVAAFRAYHDLRMTITVSPYDPDLGEHLQYLYYEIQPMGMIDFSTLIERIDDLLRDRLPHEHFEFESFARRNINSDTDTRNVLIVDRIRAKLQEIIARYESLREQR